MLKHLDKIFSLGVFFLLMISSLLMGHHGYCKARNEITSDLNHALALTIKQNDIITPDTIKAYRHLQSNSGKVLFAVADSRFCDNLKNKILKNSSYLTFDIIDDRYKQKSDYDGMVSSDTIIIENSICGETIAMRGFARISTATVFRLSDQRMSSLFALLAIAWAIASMLYIRRKRLEDNDSIRYGSLILSSLDNKFYTSDNNNIHFTPMQYQLMQMFMSSPTHTLSKEDICNTLWPKKDDANETLYTLIRRIKPIIEDNTNLKITSDRSKGYSLEIK